MWIFAHLWRATYAATGAAAIEGLSLVDTLWYLMLAEAIVLSRPRTSDVVAEAVRDGSIAYLLNKPYNFLLYHMSVGLGDTLLRTAGNLVAGGAVVWLLAGPPPPAPGWAMAMVAGALAWLLNYSITALIGLAAFVTEDVAAFEWIYSKFILVFGGVLIPLDFFPEWLQRVAMVMPFAYTVYAPARLFIEPDPGAFGNLLLWQVGWLVVLGACLNVAYRKGVAWLSINGG
jgi:ABC-2 type transport system permease protein